MFYLTFFFLSNCPAFEMLAPVLKLIGEGYAFEK